MMINERELPAEEPKPRPENVDDAEAFAKENDISAEEAQDLIDRVGHDKEKLEDAALVKNAESEN